MSHAPKGPVGPYIPSSLRSFATTASLPTTADLNSIVFDAEANVFKHWNGVTWDPAPQAPPSGAAGGSLAGSYPNPTIAADAVDTAQLADLAVETAKINDGAVTAVKLADSAVETTKINDGAVTSDKLADTAVAAGSYGTASKTASVTVDAKGRLTAASEQDIAIDAAQVTAGTLSVDRIPDLPFAKVTGEIADAQLPDKVVAGSFTYPDITVDAKGRVTAIGSGAPPVAEHNSLSGKQGGTTDEYYHLTADQSSALGGTDGTPSGTNKFVTNSDSRMANARAPSGAASGDLGGDYPGPTVERINRFQTTATNHSITNAALALPRGPTVRIVACDGVSPVELTANPIIPAGSDGERMRLINVSGKTLRFPAGNGIHFDATYDLASNSGFDVEYVDATAGWVHIKMDSDRLQGKYISTSAPATNQVLTYDGSIWKGVAASGGGIISNNITLSGGGYTIPAVGELYVITGVSANDTITLPSAVTAGTGAWVRLLDGSGNVGLHAVALTAPGGETISGYSTALWLKPHSDLEIVSDGTNWVCTHGADRISSDPRTLGILPWAWWDGTRGVTVSGKAVTAWADQSGNGRNLTGTGSIARAAAGLPGITAYGGALSLANTSLSGDLVIFSAIETSWPHPVNPTRYWLTIGDASATSGVGCGFRGDTFADWGPGEFVLWGNGWDNGRAPRVIGPDVRPLTAGVHVFAYLLRSVGTGGCALWLDGMASERVVTNGQVTLVNQTLRVAASNDGYNWLGRINEIVVYSAADLSIFDATKIDAVSTYLLRKWRP